MTEFEKVLDVLQERFNDCEEYWLDLVEHDASRYMTGKAIAKLNGIEECIMAVRRLRDEN